MQTHGGDVELGFLEGAATINTQGGKIQLDKITSAEIHLASAGGNVAARVLQGIVEINDAGAVCIQRCVSPAVSITARGPVDCAAMYADSYHITTWTPTRKGRDDRRVNHGSSQSKASVALGSSHTKLASTISTDGAAVYIGSQEGEGPITVNSHGGDVTIKLSRQVGPVTVNSGGGNITIKAGRDLFMRLEVLQAAGGRHGVHIDASHSFNPDDDSDEYTGTAVLQGHVNYRQTMSEWAEPTIDTFQVDVADRFVPKTNESGNDRAAPLPLLLDAGGGRVELLVGGWLDDILSGFSTTDQNEKQTKRNPRKPNELAEHPEQHGRVEVDIDYFGPRNKA